MNLNPKYTLIFVLLVVLASDIVLAKMHDRRTLQLVLAFLPFVASLAVAYLSRDIYRKRIEDAESDYDSERKRVAAVNETTATLNRERHIIYSPDVLPDPAPVSKAATRHEVHCFFHGIGLVLATFVDMVRIFLGYWSVGPCFSVLPIVLAGAFLRYIIL